MTDAADIMLDQIEREQHRLMAPAAGAQRAEVRQPVVTRDHCFAVVLIRQSRNRFINDRV
jgi:hypothetical protein